MAADEGPEGRLVAPPVGWAIALALEFTLGAAAPGPGRDATGTAIGCAKAIGRAMVDGG